MTSPNASVTFLLLLLSWFAFVQSFQPSNLRSIKRSSTVPSQARRKLFKLKKQTSFENGVDSDYPWAFSGRLWFRPALVRVPSGPDDPRPPASVTIINLFGWTIGGNVALEYDDSPVGPYREYVAMGATVYKRGSFGQWGSKLFVNTKAAEEVCQKTWRIPAVLANIVFSEDLSSTLKVENPPSTLKQQVQNIEVTGWKNTRILKDTEDTSKRTPSSGLPVIWTPSIKALWMPFIFLPSSKNDNSQLPVHRLRLSASAIRLKLCGQQPSDSLCIPIPIGLAIDNVLIEIARQDNEPL